MRLENAAHCAVDRCDLDYISHYTRHYGIGQIEKGRDTEKTMNMHRSVRDVTRHKKAADPLALDIRPGRAVYFQNVNRVITPLERIE